MNLPAFSNIIEIAWRGKWLNGPFILANIILIGLVGYSLIKSRDLSEDEKQKLTYAEIVLSFIGSFIVLILFIIYSFITLIGSIIKFDSQPFFLFIFYFTCVLLTPFSLTMVRVGLNDKLSEQQKNIISGLTVPVALFGSYLTVLITSGYFFD